MQQHQQPQQLSSPSQMYPTAGSVTSAGNCCRVCGTPTELRRCSSCKAAFYCSQTHQQSDWPNHRAECRQLSRLLAVRQHQQMQHQQQLLLHEQYHEHQPQHEHGLLPKPNQYSSGNGSGDGVSSSFSSNETASAMHHIDDADMLQPQPSATSALTPFQLAAAQMQQQHQQLMQQQQKRELEKKERDLRNFSAENTMRVSEMSLMESAIGAR